MTPADRRQAQMTRLKAECDRQAAEKAGKPQSEPESFELEPGETPAIKAPRRLHKDASQPLSNSEKIAHLFRL